MHENIQNALLTNGQNCDNPLI